ncbi:MAG: hypothetical protein HOO06_10780 [Bdellovibrionaceae bacterium]|nr:hypothetical protein [Pseudobdellovibrionaceae bacterium]
MKNLQFVLLTVILLFNTSLFARSALLEQACADDGGDIVNKIICPSTEATKNGKFCVSGNMFYDGCSASVPGYEDFFFNSCVLHDFCYHHEPSTNGKSKIDCDKEFLANLNFQCSKHKSPFKCRLTARTFYQAVARFGESSWQCSDVVADYPDKL